MMYQDEWSLKNVSPVVMGLTGNPVALVESEITLPSVNFQSRPKNWP
ncbi:MAG: hypothetical protein JWP77_2785 [Polaromonas sp.]|jgi:hypothetical protein|nr:hypothetical protein [Polaromonas sp.]